jgi:uncharacterized protein (DUF362 family)
MGLELFERGALPRWTRVRQRLDDLALEDIGAAMAAQFQRPEIARTIEPGMKVALTGGSRGIDRIAEVLAAAVREVKHRGAEPFIIPAMGSHGGATAEGQTALLAEYGITPETMGCPIKSSMEAVHLGDVENGVPVWFDKNAYTGADATIPVGRVKPHTDFHGPVESGLMKMIAIGLGKQKGADVFHGRGFAEFHHLIPAVAQLSLSKVNIPFGLALVEDGHSRCSLIEAVPAAQIWDREQELLKIARERMPRLPGDLIDVLIIDAIGKDISGIGADTNVINRYYDGPLPFKPRIQRLIIRDLTRDTEGNASGLGLGDVALRQAVDKVNFHYTYMNCVTAKTPEGARVPLTVDTDREALSIALACCLQTEVEQARIARIRDTKHLDEFWASEPWLPELLATGRVEPLCDPQPIAFDDGGMFCA